MSFPFLREVEMTGFFQVITVGGWDMGASGVSLSLVVGGKFDEKAERELVF